jgi:hypothetical protein
MEQCHMKRLFGLALLVLPVVAGTSRAELMILWNGCPYKIEAGASAYFRCVTKPTGPGGGPAGRGPWYCYWPLEAHFQTPGHPEFPYYPAPQGLPAKPELKPAPKEDSQAPADGPSLKPAGYRQTAPISYTQPYRTGGAPSYWYDR